MGIVDEDIARVREASDITGIIGQYSQLKRVGRRWVGLCPFHAEKTASFSVNAEEGLWYCLAGETRVITWDGIRDICDLAGGVHRILTERGRWVSAPFCSFGIQPLVKVTLTRNGQRKEIFATREHRWLVRESRGRRYERSTLDLRTGAALAWSYPQNRLKHMSDLSPSGIAHGITFGGGSRLGPVMSADLHGDKDAQLLKYFPLSRTYELVSHNGNPYTKVLDLPYSFKERPSLDEAPSYLAGWLAGYFAADGHVAKDGTCLLNSANRATLEFVRDMCTRLGIGTYGITAQLREGCKGREASALFRIHFINEDLEEHFFLLDEHRRRFAASTKARVRRGWVVESVEPTDRVEEVFCAVVDGTHNFALEDNILTGNCFGCQAKGDIITFVREIEHLDFVAAVEWLAAKAGVTLRYTDTGEGESRKRRARLVDAMAKAVDWYHQRLLHGEDAGTARGYLRSRGFDGEAVRQYSLGWAPDAWDELASALRLPDDVWTDAGLGFLNRNNRQTDAFRGRVLFPIFDTQGDPVAFGGRVLPGGDGPKYKNSPETKLYSKSRVLYGLNWSKADIVTGNQAIVCEGYTDVIGFSRSGLPRAVATCGTALTEEHLRLLAKFARRIVLAFDADAAGQQAAERFYAWERQLELEVLVADLPSGVDPGDLAQSDPARLVAAVDGARPFLRFRVDRVLAEARLDTAEARAAAAEAALAVISEHPSELVRDQYVMDVADHVRLDADRLRARLRTPGAVRVRPAAAPMRPVDRDNPELEVLRHAVHAPEAVAPWLEETMFASERTLAAFRALSASMTLHEAIARADPGASELLQRLAVEETDSDADDAVARLVAEAARRRLRDLDAAARRANDSDVLVALRDLAPIRLAVEQLRETETRAAALPQLVAWLKSWSQEPV